MKERAGSGGVATDSPPLATPDGSDAAESPAEVSLRNSETTEFSTVSGKLPPAFPLAPIKRLSPRFNPLADPLIYLVVFCGGTLGTALRYGTTLLLPGRMSASGALNAVHMATFLVNMLTAFGFAMLAAYMAQASWIRKRTRRVASQGLGTGLCGGLSTLSTLAMEAVVSLGQGKVGGAALYLLLTFGCGLLLTYLGAYLGLSLASGHRGRAARTQAGGGLGSTGPEAGKADSEESSAVSLDWTDESAADRRTAGDSGQDGRPLGQESPSFEPAPITAEVPLVPDPVWGEAR